MDWSQVAAGNGLTRTGAPLDQPWAERAPFAARHWHERQFLPKAIRTDNGKEFCSRAMLTWAHARGVQLFLIEPGKLNQNAYIESFNGRFRDECLNEHWFTSLMHARVIIEAWRREYNEERSKKLWEA